uniref:Uncharacterized protein n=1 Tax=Musa acuminata subsp. malaccensis TaxID=214687 RepID=A0A804U5N4_MUSAM
MLQPRIVGEEHYER